MTQGRPGMNSHTNEDNTKKRRDVQDDENNEPDPQEQTDREKTKGHGASSVGNTNEHRNSGERDIFLRSF